MERGRHYSVPGSDALIDEMMHENTDIWTRTRALPDDPRFYRRTLDEQPSPLVVVDGAGRIVYGNQAMLELGGWSEAGGLNADLLGFIHPDDVERISESFLALASTDESSDHWAPIAVRLVDYSGNAVHVEVTGRNRIEDDIIDGVIYSVRPMQEQHLERRVIRSIVDGVSRVELFETVLELVSARPLDLEGAVVSTLDGRSVSILAAHDDDLAKVVTGTSLSSIGVEPTPAVHSARSFAFADVDGRVGERLVAAGFEMGWVQTVVVGEVSVLALSRRHHASDAGIRQRLQIASDLVGAIQRVRD